MSEAAQRADPAPRGVPVRAGVARAADGAELRWRCVGDGPGVPILCSNGIGVSSFFWHFIAEGFGAERPVVTWDYRGHGATEVPANPGEVTVESCARDLWSVADSAGIREAILIGHSMGCQVSLEAIRIDRKRVAAFVPMLGAPGRTLTSFPFGKQLRPLLERTVDLLATKPELAEFILRTTLRAPGLWPAVQTLRLVHPDLCPREEFAPYFAHLAALDLRVYFSLLRDLLSHDASDLLPSLKMPVLVVAGSRDLFTPMVRSEEMAAAIPGAELLVVRDGSHAALVEQPELIQLALERFLRRHQLAQKKVSGG